MSHLDALTEQECRQVEALERALLDPVVRADRSQVDALLAEDFMEIGASGAVFGKRAALDAVPAERGVSFEARSMRTRVVTQDVACVVYAATRTHGTDVRRSLRSSWWRREADGHWRMVFHQGTPDTGLGTMDA
ncbi:nuclear transport factor 2 family protein [Luteimonas viscosa]|uniref:Nuclear transport factor 2 family protein n=1 Tax=Luteimonas viscosa TaxID=1132694 RepID=A0A5D4XM40_9GAMM|nr:nuclear transport factor 2 family protein [Luteimonas viscosa]TYT25629.1 nuclear transport factor 2 family protein [Luteimonas viscosa]